MKRFLLSLLVVLVCFVLGRLLTGPTTEQASVWQPSMEPSDSIIPADRRLDAADWITKLSEVFEGWETPGSAAAFRARFQLLEQHGSQVYACALARLLSEWQAADGADLLRFALERPERPEVLIDGRVLCWSLQLLFHQEPQIVLPYLRQLQEDGLRSRLLTEKWLTAAAGEDSIRRRALVERYEPVSNDQALPLSDPKAALADALASGESIDRILIAWGRQNPRAAWKAATEHLDPFNGGNVFERLFFTWSYANPREAFEFRHDIAEALVNSNLGEVRNAGYVHHVIAEQLAKRDTPQAISLALDLELGGPFESFIYGVREKGRFPGLTSMVPVLQKMPADHWIRCELLQWIKENEASEEVLRWAGTNLPSTDQEALSKLYKPPPPQEPQPIAPPIDPIAAAQQTWEDRQDTDAFAGHLRKWIEADASSVRRWVEEQADPKLMDTWRSIQVSALMKSPDGDAEKSYALSLEISDPRQR